MITREEIGEQLIETIKIENQRPHKIEIDIDADYLNDSIVDHQITYYNYADRGNSVLLLQKTVDIAYYHTELEKNIYFQFRLRDGKWEYAGRYEK